MYMVDNIYKKKIIDIQTGKETILDCTPEEVAEIEANIAQNQINIAKENEIAALKQSAKAKLIAGQPLTADEANTLVI